MNLLCKDGIFSGSVNDLSAFAHMGGKLRVLEELNLRLGTFITTESFSVVSNLTQKRIQSLHQQLSLMARWQFYKQSDLI